MAQKVIPTSLRLKHQKNWLSEWFVDKRDFSKNFHTDLMIQNYLNSLLSDYQYKIFIKKKVNFKTIYIYFLKKDKNYFLKKQIQTQLNQIFPNQQIKIVFVQLNLRFLKKQKIFKSFLKKLKQKRQFIPNLVLFKIIFFTQNISLLTKLIVKGLEKTPKHFQYIKKIEKTFLFFFQHYSGFQGYKIQ